MEVLSPDVISVIFGNLSYVDMMAFRWSCKCFTVIKMPDFRNILIFRLFPLIGLDPSKDLGCFFDLNGTTKGYEALKVKIIDCLDVESGNFHDAWLDAHSHYQDDMKNLRYNLLEELYQSGGAISGSFILDCLYGTNYHNDIDIYEPEGKSRNFPPSSYSPVVERSLFRFGDTSLKFTQFLYLCGFMRVKSPTRCDSVGDLSRIRNFRPVEFDAFQSWEDFSECTPQETEYRRNQFQIIPIEMLPRSGNRSCVPQLINATFDLDICKNIFNGRELMVRSWHKLLYRRDYIKCHMRGVMNFYSNFEKTTKDLRHSPPYVDLTSLRLKKYRSRGFDIDPHPQTAEMISEIDDVLASPMYQLDKRCNKFQAIMDGTINLDKYYLQ